MKNVLFNVGLIGFLIAILIILISLAARPTSTTLVVDGINNIAYAEAINKIYNEGLSAVSHETARLANSYISDQGVNQIVLLDPTAENVKDFYELARYHNAQLIIGSTYNETELKSKIFELGLDNKKIQLKTGQDWDPDNLQNMKKDYTY